ncbi:MAG: polyprenyl synthetase family protein [Alphaproteobacteria bacterium]
MARLKQALRETALAVDGVLDGLLPLEEGVSDRLPAAMRYATLSGGKRFRPFLVVTGARLFGVEDAQALRVGAAVEMVHCYSLVHDDLPAMDDDAMRRGQPTCHIAFDEATAILAGDALLTLAFEVLSGPETHPDSTVRADLVRGLAAAAGGSGMVRGQMMDLAAEHQRQDEAAIIRLQELKTAALITFACEAGAVLGQAPSEARAALRDYGRYLGLAFQVADDLLDLEGSPVDTGKAVGKDTAAGKATLVVALGPAAARARAVALAREATERLEPFAEKAGLLREAAAFVVNRRG